MVLSRMARAGRRLHAAVESALREAESPLSPPGVELLRTVAMLGRATRSDVARELGVRPRSLQRLITTFAAEDVKPGFTERGAENVKPGFPMKSAAPDTPSLPGTVVMATATRMSCSARTKRRAWSDGS
jgi:hypothetical protein